VFVVGNAGTGKTQVWKTMFRAYQNMKRKPVFNDLNPKAVTNDELFGIINPNTREWKDGEIIISISISISIYLTFHGSTIKTISRI
jgi:MoxR-like ATPase